MEKEEIFNQLEKKIREELNDPCDHYDNKIKKMKITFKTKLAEDLGWDSMERYEFVYLIEEDMKIRVPDEKANEFETVGDCVNYIHENYERLKREYPQHFKINQKKK